MKMKARKDIDYTKYGFNKIRGLVNAYDLVMFDKQDLHITFTINDGNAYFTLESDQSPYRLADKIIETINDDGEVNFFSIQDTIDNWFEKNIFMSFAEFMPPKVMFELLVFGHLWYENE